MKKLLIGILFTFISYNIFAEPFAGCEKLIEDFLQNGTYIKVISKKGIIYYSKSNVISIDVYDDNLEIRTDAEVESYNGKDTNEPEFSVKKFDINSDSNGNIIVTKKPE